MPAAEARVSPRDSERPAVAGLPSRHHGGRFIGAMKAGAAPTPGDGRKTHRTAGSIARRGFAVSLAGEVGSVGGERTRGRPDSYAFDSEGSNGPGMLLRVLTLRVPAWVTIVLVAAATGFGIVVATRTSVTWVLRSGMRVRRRSRSRSATRSSTAERSNPHAAALAFESGLRQAGVKEPDVAIERIDCGPAGPGTSRMTSPTVTRRDSRVFATVPIMQAVRIL